MNVNNSPFNAAASVVLINAASHVATPGVAASPPVGDEFVSNGRDEVFLLEYSGAGARFAL